MLRRNLKLKTFVIVSVAVVVIIAGLLVGAVRVVDLIAPNYRDEVAARVSARLERPVAIGALDLSWDWDGPVLYLNQLSILDAPAGESVISLDKLAVHFSAWELLRQHYQPRGITLEAPHLAAYRDAQGKLRIRGMESGQSETDWTALVSQLGELEFIQITAGELLWSPNHDTQKNLLIDSISITLNNRGQRRQLDAQLQLPATLGDSAEFKASIIGDTNNLGQLTAHAYFNARNLDLTALVNAAGFDTAAPETGRNDLELWSDWRLGEFTSARASVAGKAFEPPPEIATANARLANAPSQAKPVTRLLPPGVGMDLSVAPVAQGYRISLNALRGDDGYQPQIDGHVLVKPDERFVHAQLEDLPTQLFNGWLPMLNAGPAWQTEGNLDSVELVYNGAQAPPQLDLGAVFSDVRIINPLRGLQIDGLNGALELTRENGSFQLRGENGALVWAEQINGEFPLDTLDAHIDWQQKDGGWQFQVEKLRWLGANASVIGNGTVELPAEGAPVADLSAQVKAQDMPRLLAYLPQGPELPSPRLHRWLFEAVRAGELTDGEVVLRGPLNHFPFAQGGGKFKFDANLKNAALDYKPGWPALSDGKAQLVLESKRLTIEAEQATILGVRVGPATATIANVGTPILKINGGVSNAAASQLFSFLPNSPLKEKFGRLADALEVGGRADLALNLSIPLKSELGEVTADGRITLKETTLVHRVLPAPIKNIRGELSFTREGLHAQGLRGDLLSLPLLADLRPAPGGALSINASTLVRLPRDRIALQSFVPDAVANHVGGESTWHAALDVGTDGKVSDLKLRSDLDGISLNFPPPLNKAENGPLPIRVEVGGNRDRVHVELGNRLDLLLRSNDGQVQAMDLVFGDTDAVAPAGDGIWLGGNIEQLDVLAWKSFIAGLSDAESRPSGERRAKLTLRGANLSIQETLLGGQRMQQIQVDVSPLANGDGWDATVSGPGASGKLVLLPPPPRAVGARALLNGKFNRIELRPYPEATLLAENKPEAATGEPPQDPAQLPVTDIVIEKIIMDGEKIGRLNLQARAITGGIELTTLSITGGQLDIDTHGNWLRKNGLTQAQVDANVNGEGLDSLLRTLGYTANISAEKTDISAKLKISPNPDGLSPAALDGSIAVKFDDGTLISVDPGAGRVLGLFNFYALPRRFLLDFRDVVDQGLAFDSIRGNFNVQSGLAHSDDLSIKMPSATVRIKGTVDLAGHSYDQQVTVVPKVSSGVAVAGTVLGGPAVGAALLVAQKLLEKPIANLSTIKYHLTGNWQDPKIETITADDSLESGQE